MRLVVAGDLKDGGQRLRQICADRHIQQRGRVQLDGIADRHRARCDDGRPRAVESQSPARSGQHGRAIATQADTCRANWKVVRAIGI